jgi:phosphoglycolate phosphatase
MLNQINLGNAELYTNSLRTLEKLKKRGYTLIFLSNCGANYMEASRKQFDLDRYFDYMYCAESYDFIPKDEILTKIKSRFPENQVIVGDRFHDIQAGIKNNVDSIWCEYGYGKAEEAEGASVRIKDIGDIINFL